MPKKNPYELSDYADFSKANEAEQKKKEAENAADHYGPFQYGRQDAYDQAIDAIINMKPFQYNMNADALYEQYRNQYQNLGKLAMEDTVGKASAMTGGYGNSYAATAGNQAYQSYLDQLNGVIPQLYSMALNRYQADADRAQNALSALSADRSTQYGQYQDQLNRLLTDRDYYGNEYNNAYNVALQIARNAIADEQDQRNFAYQQERDRIADEQWQKNYNLSAASAARSAAKNTSSENALSLSDYNKIKETAEGFTTQRVRTNKDGEEETYTVYDNNGLYDYLAGLARNGIITEDEAYNLYNSYRGEEDSRNKNTGTGWRNIFGGTK